MLYMDKLPFWVTDMYLKGSQRIYKNDLTRLSKFKQRFLKYFLKTPPGWCEIAYLNKLQIEPTERDLLLGWVISTIKQEHGFAMNLANQGIIITNNDIFKDMYKYSSATLGGMKGYYRLSTFILKRITKRVFA